MSIPMFKSYASKKICISFDWHNDRNYRNLLGAMNANQNSPIDFIDLTPGAVNTDSVSVVKTRLNTQIRAATHTLVLVGKYANTQHKDSAAIGSLNWIWWEIEQSKLAGNKLIAVKIESTNAPPTPLLNSGAKWAMSFNVPAILKAIDEA